MHLSILTTLALAAGTALADGTIKLPYIEVSPVQDFTNSSGTILQKPVVAWYSIPYAAPPTGDLRFRKAVPPKGNLGKLALQNYGPVCRQGGLLPESEDCLTLSIFRPQGKPQKKLPVVIWVPGGAFNTGGGRSLNVPSFVGNAPDDFIGVSINYRLGAFGGIPSTVGHEEGAINLGLHDQVAAFEWVQKYIKEFGGDPKQVTIFGESAGAHSVGAHLQHPWPKHQRPFNQAIMNSGGPAARAWPDWTFPLYERQAGEFFNLVGCDQAEGRWDCLRGVEADRMTNASVTLYQRYNAALSWPFQPVVDYDYVTRAPSESWDQGQFERVPVITGFNTNEGSFFVPRGLDTDEQFRQFFRVLFPLGTEAQFEEISRLYPDPVTVKDSPYADSPAGFGAQWKRISAAYGDYAYIATVRENALSIAAQKDNKAPVWKYHFDKVVGIPTVPPEFGVAHATELQALVQVLKSDVATKMTAYYSSFIVKGDPNKLVPKDYPQWPAYRTDAQREMLFGQSDVGVVDDDLRTRQLDWWLSVPGIAPH